VWRPDPGGGLSPLVAMVHRPSYDDWSLPKGKLDAGEHPLIGAVREVFEETAVQAVPETSLPSVRYQVPKRGAPGVRVDKTVEYWSMRARSWQPRAADDEVDEVRWVTPAEAVRLLTYPHDQAVVGAFVAQPLVTGVVAVVRHARAVPRDRYVGDDRRRPLTPEGAAEAEALAPLLALLRPERIVAATPDRCARTLAPLSALTDLPVTADPQFDDEADPATAATTLQSLAGGQDPTVVCSQGRIIPTLLGLLTNHRPAQFHTRKGTGWLLAFADGRAVAASALRPLAALRG
jgi:8-oxo-dGTP pyrophosphatase MutT (NUDIX family)